MCDTQMKTANIFQINKHNAYILIFNLTYNKGSNTQKYRKILATISYTK